MKIVKDSKSANAEQYHCGTCNADADSQQLTSEMQSTKLFQYIFLLFLVTFVVVTYTHTDCSQLIVFNMCRFPTCQFAKPQSDFTTSCCIVEIRAPLTSCRFFFQFYSLLFFCIVFATSFSELATILHIVDLDCKISHIFFLFKLHCSLYCDVNNLRNQNN